MTGPVPAQARESPHRLRTVTSWKTGYSGLPGRASSPNAPASERQRCLGQCRFGRFDHHRPKPIVERALESSCPAVKAPPVEAHDPEVGGWKPPRPRLFLALGFSLVASYRHWSIPCRPRDSRFNPRTFAQRPAPGPPSSGAVPSGWSSSALPPSLSSRTRGRCACCASRRESGPGTVSQTAAKCGEPRRVLWRPVGLTWSRKSRTSRHQSACGPNSGMASLGELMADTPRSGRRSCVHLFGLLSRGGAFRTNGRGRARTIDRGTRQVAADSPVGE